MSVGVFARLSLSACGMQLNVRSLSNLPATMQILLAKAVSKHHNFKGDTRTTRQKLNRYARPSLGLPAAWEAVPWPVSWLRSSKDEEPPHSPFQGATGTSTFTWAPIIGHKFLPQSLSKASINRDVNINFGFGMDKAFEGENFIPPGLKLTTSSPSSLKIWLRGFLPVFSNSNIGLVEEMYPANGQQVLYNTTYPRAQLIFRDSALACPLYWIASAAHKASYARQYGIPLAHGSEMGYCYLVNATFQERSDPIYLGYSDSASFFETADRILIMSPNFRTFRYTLR